MFILFYKIKYKSITKYGGSLMKLITYSANRQLTNLKTMRQNTHCKIPVWNTATLTWSFIDKMIHALRVNRCFYHKWGMTITFVMTHLDVKVKVFRFYIAIIWPWPCVGEILHHRSSVWMDATPSNVPVQRTVLAQDLNLWNQPPSGSEPQSVCSLSQRRMRRSQCSYWCIKPGQCNLCINYISWKWDSAFLSHFRGTEPYFTLPYFIFWRLNGCSSYAIYLHFNDKLRFLPSQTILVYFRHCSVKMQVVHLSTSEEATILSHWKEHHTVQLIPSLCKW